MPEWESEEVGVTITIDYNLCTGVGDCVNNCPVEVYELVDGKAMPTNIDERTECCTCVASCPNDAITHSSC